MKPLIVAMLLGISLLLGAESAECAYCPTYTCYAPCGAGCVCITAPGEFGGSCYGVERAPALLARGYQLVR